MHYKRSFFLAVLITAVCSGPLFAQATAKAKFVSQDGGFAIDLPRNTSVGLQPIGIVAIGANSYEWETAEGRFTVSYIEGSFPPDEGASTLNSLAHAVISEQRTAGGKLTARREFEFDGNPAIELQIDRPDTRAINRFILVKNKLYVLTGDVPQDSDGKAAARILDSFELIDSATLIA